MTRLAFTGKCGLFGTNGPGMAELAESAAVALLTALPHQAGQGQIPKPGAGGFQNLATPQGWNQATLDCISMTHDRFTLSV